MVLIEYVEPVPEFESDRHIYIRIYENEEINSDVARQVMQIMLNENIFLCFKLFFTLKNLPCFILYTL